MKLRILALAGVAGLLVSCGGAEDTPEACRYAVAQAIDQRDYSTALEKINSSACSDAYTSEERSLTVAAIYLGKAGYDVPTLVNDMTGVDTAAAGSYQQFVNAFGKRASGANLENLGIAVEYYRGMLGNDASPGQPGLYCETNQASLTTLQKDACFDAALAQTAISANSLSLLFGGDTSSWDNPAGCAPDGNDTNGNTTADQAEATACAILYASDGTTTTCVDVSVTPLGTRDFVVANGRSGTFTELAVTVAGAGLCTGVNNVYYIPVTSSPSGSPVLTEGLCKANNGGVYEACSTVDPASCLPCPVIDAQGGVSVTQTIVDALNSGSSALLGAVGGGNSDVQQSMDDFKAEACGGDNNCTDADIANYLSQPAP